jgi:hypothetical protein
VDVGQRWTYSRDKGPGPRSEGFLSRRPGNDTLMEEIRENPPCLAARRTAGPPVIGPGAPRLRGKSVFMLGIELGVKIIA